VFLCVGWRLVIYGEIFCEIRPLENRKIVPASGIPRARVPLTSVPIKIQIPPLQLFAEEGIE
jgi:hypothetical protein